MQDRKGSNWTGTPRTMREAFPQCPGPDYVEPTIAEKILDVIVVVGLIAALGFAARAIYIAAVLS